MTRKKANIMAHINENYLKLKAGYLFPEISRRVNAFAAANPSADVIRLGIGDVVKGIPRPIVDAMIEATEEMAHDESFQGYPPDQGQEFLREAIAEHDFAARGVKIDIDEIFVSDGAKCDSGNLQEIFQDRIDGSCAGRQSPGRRRRQAKQDRRGICRLLRGEV